MKVYNCPNCNSPFKHAQSRDNHIKLNRCSVIKEQINMQKSSLHAAIDSSVENYVRLFKGGSDPVGFDFRLNAEFNGANKEEANTYLNKLLRELDKSNNPVREPSAIDYRDATFANDQFTLQQIQRFRQQKEAAPKATISRPVLEFEGEAASKYVICDHKLE